MRNNKYNVLQLKKIIITNGSEKNTINSITCNNITKNKNYNKCAKLKCNKML